MRTYSELIKIDSFRDRFEYLKLGGGVGIETFGVDRYLNQLFYNTNEWRQLRNHIIVRDMGCDMADKDHEIYSKIYIHHMNPITVDDIINRKDYILDPEYLVCVSFNTHQAIHYGNYDLIFGSEIVERRPGDTCLWSRVR